MPSYEDMMEYVLDMGRECECCSCAGWCAGLTLGPSGPQFPPCASKDFSELLIAEQVMHIYKEDHDND